MFRKALFASLLMMAGSAIADFPRAELTAGFHRIEAEVVATPADRAGPDEPPTPRAQPGHDLRLPRLGGALLLDEEHLLPLSIAFLDEEGRHHQHRRDGAGNRRQPLPVWSGALCAGNECRLVQGQGLKAGSVIGGVGKLPPGQ